MHQAYEGVRSSLSGYHCDRGSRVGTRGFMLLPAPASLATELSQSGDGSAPCLHPFGPSHLCAVTSSPSWQERTEVRVVSQRLPVTQGSPAMPRLVSHATLPAIHEHLSGPWQTSLVTNFPSLHVSHESVPSLEQVSDTIEEHEPPARCMGAH